MAGIAADAVLLLHLAFILFAVFGGLLVLRHPRLIWLHVPALLWGIWIEISHGVCPLTELENALREAAGKQAYGDGFIAHYLVPLIYPPGLTASQQIMLAAAISAWSFAIYGLIAQQFWRRAQASQ